VRDNSNPSLVPALVPCVFPDIRMVCGPVPWFYFCTALLVLSVDAVQISVQSRVHLRLRTKRRSYVAPWAASNKSDQYVSHGRNLCVKGKQVPDLYVLGVQKAATTSLAMDLSAAGMTPVPLVEPTGVSSAKERHFFDYKIRQYEIENDNQTAPRQELSSMFLDGIAGNGNCSDASTDPRSVMADFTPDYLRLVPRPKSDYGPGLMTVNRWDLDISMPWRLRSIYGDENAAKVQFAILLREPLSQMQSAWYNAVDADFKSICFSCKAPSFKAALKSHLDQLESPSKPLSEWLWVTFYGRQIEHWVSEFAPSQFYVIPMKHYSKGDKDSVCRELSRRLQFKMECDSHGVAAQHSWAHDHPKLDADVGQELLNRWETAMAKEKKRLVQVLTKAHQQGMTLAGFEGKAGDEVAVQKWLEEGW